MTLEDREKLNLEHILPENPGANWPEFTAEDAEAFYKRIGNMVLLLSSKNSLIGNSKFEAKRPHFLSSGLSLTKMVGASATWNRDEIIVRQKKLAEFAVKTWPITVR